MPANSGSNDRSDSRREQEPRPRLVCRNPRGIASLRSIRVRAGPTRLSIGIDEAVAQALTAALRVVDVATPATEGSMEGWPMTPATGFCPLPFVLPGLKDFYMAGQWVSPGGGLPSGLMTPKSVSQMICRDHRRRWKAAWTQDRVPAYVPEFVIGLFSGPCAPGVMMWCV